MKNDCVIGLSLSGGLDSRLISSLIDKKKHSIFCFTFGAKNGRDEKFAKKTAKLLGFKCNFFELKNHFSEFAEKSVYFTDGMLGIDNFHQISLLDQLRKKFDIMIFGIAFGEMFGDFHILDRNVFKIKDDEAFAKYLYDKWNCVIRDEKLQTIFSENFYKKIKGRAFNSLKKEIEKSKTKAQNYLNRIYYILFKNNNVRTLYLHPTFIRAYTEIRLPQFDNDFVDFILTISPKLRFNRKLQFEILKKVSPELAKIPFSRPILAQSMKRHSHAAYRTFMTKLRNITRTRIQIPDKIDYGEWLRESRKLFEDILLSNRTLNRGFLNEKKIRQMVKDHMDGKKEYEKDICMVSTFEIFNRLFLDKINLKI